MLRIAYHLLSTLLVEFLGLLNRSIARSVSRNWVPVADIKRRLADAFITRNKCVNDVIAITHEGSLNCNLRLSHLFICNKERIVCEYYANIKRFCLQPKSNFWIFNSYLCWISQIINAKYNLSKIAEQKTEHNCNQDASQFCFSFLWAWNRLKNLNVQWIIGKKYDVSIYYSRWILVGNILELLPWSM